MKCIFYIFLIFSSLSAQITISILDFEGEDVQDKLLRACYNQLEMSLIKSNLFTIIDRSHREQILAEKKFQYAGVCDDACTNEIGQIIGAEYLMLSEIIGFGDLYQVNIKIVNIEKGNIAEKFTNEIKGGMSGLLNGMESASQEIVRRITYGSAPKTIMKQHEGITTSVGTYGSIDVTSKPVESDMVIDAFEYGVTTKTIAVFDFENNGIKDREVRQLTTRLESELVKIGGFRVVERTRIDDILKEQKLQMSGCVEECLIDVGKMLGAEQIVMGSVGEMGGLITLSVKLVDAESGELIKTSNYDAMMGLSELIRDGLNKVALELASIKIPSRISYPQQTRYENGLEKEYNETPIVRVYGNTSYKGAMLIISSSISKLGDKEFKEKGWFKNWNDRLSSLKIKKGYQIVLYEHSNYQGDSILLKKDYPDLHEIGWGDRASSIKIKRKNE